MLDVPVLLIIFNRPDCTQNTFAQIRAAQPRKLYVAADGPRENYAEDVENCQLARQVALDVDWPCQMHTRLQEQNMGCGRAVSDAISWMFKHEESGIILEDDCVASPSFFSFCSQLLKKYHDDPRVMHINGNNFNAPFNQIRDSKNLPTYYFGSFAQAWGWAGWRRAWEKFDYKIQTWPQNKGRRHFIKKFPQIGNYLEKALHFDFVYSGRDDIWDYQWQHAVLDNDGLAIVPTKNLVSNIGYGQDATHIKTFERHRNALQTQRINGPIRHPPLQERIKKIDLHYAKHMGMRFKSKHIFKYLTCHL